MTSHIRHRPVIVLGMHRSGTSMVGDLLQQAGLYMGSKLNIHGESVAFLKANRALLKHAHAHWDVPGPFRWLLETPQACRDEQLFLQQTMESWTFRRAYSGRITGHAYHDGPWGWKDPLNTITFPLWHRLYPDASYVFVYRHGVDVANSLVTREHTRKKSSGLYSVRCLSLDRAFDLWAEYNTYFLDRYEIIKDRTILIRYEDLLLEPAAQLSRLARHAELDVGPDTLSHMASRLRSDRAYSFQKSPTLSGFARDVSTHPVLLQLGYT
jgi:hypothetical protein